MGALPSDGNKLPLFAKEEDNPPTKTQFWLSQNIPRREDYTKKIKVGVPTVPT